MTESKTSNRELLVQAGAISEEQLSFALAEQKQRQRKCRVLTDLGYADEDELLSLLSKQLKIPFVDLKQFNFDIGLVRRLPEIMARRFRAIVLQEEGESCCRYGGPHGHLCRRRAS